MNLRRIFCVLELIILVFRVLCIKYVTKYIKFPFIWHTVRLCSLISVGVTGKSVKNQFFDFSQFCQKNFFKMECQNFCQYCHFSCKNGTQKQKNKRESTLQRKMEMDYSGPSLAQVYRCYSTCGYLEASQEKSKIWSKKSYLRRFH